MVAYILELFLSNEADGMLFEQFEYDIIMTISEELPAYKNFSAARIFVIKSFCSIIGRSFISLTFMVADLCDFCFLDSSYIYFP